MDQNTFVSDEVTILSDWGNMIDAIQDVFYHLIQADGMQTNDHDLENPNEENQLVNCCIYWP